MTMKPSQIYNQFDVIVVPFPFSERASVKRRPAVVLSKSRGYHEESGCVLAAMITSAQHEPWASDVPITRLQTAGLKQPCVVRLKLFTLDTRLIAQTIGSLHAADRRTLKRELLLLIAG